MSYHTLTSLLPLGPDLRLAVVSSPFANLYFLCHFIWCVVKAAVRPFCSPQSTETNSTGGMVAKWLALSPPTKKVLGSLPGW